MILIKIYTYGMPLFIKHAEADRLARQLAKATGESITDVVVMALRERLARQQGQRAGRSLKEELYAIGKRCAARPVIDRRTPEEIIGYDQDGVPR